MKKDDAIGVQFGEEVSGKTIVGGRGTVRKPKPVPIPTGIEKVLYLASTDPAFKTDLLNNREAVVSDPKYRLNEIERGILYGIPLEQLSMMIERIDPVAHGRRKFIQKVAVAAVGLAALSTAIESCGEADVSPCCDGGGSRPDIGDKGDVLADVHQAPDAGGARPDAGDGGWFENTPEDQPAEDQADEKGNDSE